ncbi:hypothetical protein Cph01nite_10360 [Cellulomonas phragmiteti]|uniref:DoxX family protein n=1 Tax=Cellulomonas phragmiteti TaxID=478780 RepID=A0ABQ4DIV0_9CELL|nr:hypothetical protein Cph01nite_10360 [Cellulomonas phragmiteti]
MWIVQVLLAVAFLAAGAMKVARPRDELARTLAWAADYRPATIKVIGLLEVLGGLGLVLPALTGIAPVLVPLAAVGLAVVMVGAVVVHARRGEQQMIGVNVVLLLLALFVAWARFGAHAL